MGYILNLDARNQALILLLIPLPAFVSILSIYGAIHPLLPTNTQYAEEKVASTGRGCLSKYYPFPFRLPTPRHSQHRRPKEESGVL